MGMIKVLWIDDECNTNIGASFKENASVNDIEIIGAEDLRSGEEIIRKNSNEIHAVILDCFCKIEKNGIEDDGEFLKQALAHGSSIHKYPWFIMSAGAVKGDIKHILKYGVNRPLWMDENEEMYYDKIADTDKLFDDIKRIVSNWDDYMIQMMYQDVFSIIDKNECLKETKVTLIEILSALHFPQKYDFRKNLYYNQLRQVLENVFRWCHHNGLLPNECIDKGKVNIWESYNYLSGKGMINLQIRYGEQGESVLPILLDKQLQQLIYLCNEFSHSNSKKQNIEYEKCKSIQISMREFIENQKSPRSLFALTLVVLDTINFLRDFLDKHSMEENLKKITYFAQLPEGLESLKNEYEGKSFLIEKDEDGFFHCGICLISDNREEHIVNRTYASLLSIEENTKPRSKNKYPIYGKYKIQ